MTNLSFAGAVFVASLAVGGTVAGQNVAPHAPDGGTIERVQSVEIPLMPNAPFSAVVVTEWTRIMPDGSTALMKNHRTVARDSAGRVFQERRYFSPDGDKQVTRLSELDYEDPTLHHLLRCYPDAKICQVYKVSRPATAIALSPQTSKQTAEAGMQWEDLGRKTVDNVEVLGSREVMTIGVGTIGNEKAQPVVKEFWYSPRLGINVITKRFDPRASAVQNFDVTNINQGEPDAQLFRIPSDFKMIEMQEQVQLLTQQWPGDLRATRQCRACLW